jgi:(+)-trans-carveol dehydrogenase
VETGLQGKVALITGAARGQGRRHAIALAQQGVDIIAVDRCSDVGTVPYPLATKEDLAETVRQVEALDRRIVATEADVRDSAALTAAVDDGVAQLGRLDIVSANAGILSFGTADQLSDESWEDMIGVNLTGVWKTCRAAIPHIVAGGRGGTIVLTSSVAGLKAYGGLPHYVAAKHGVVGLMKAMANELAPQNIRVNSINPTQVDTDMVQNEAMYKLWSPDEAHPTREMFGAKSRATGLLPVDWVEVDDISNALIFLVSDMGRYITGIALPVDAGVLARS